MGRQTQSGRSWGPEVNILCWKDICSLKKKIKLNFQKVNCSCPKYPLVHTSSVTFLLISKGTLALLSQLVPIPFILVSSELFRKLLSHVNQCFVRQMTSGLNGNNDLNKGLSIPFFSPFTMFLCRMELRIKPCLHCAIVASAGSFQTCGITLKQ